MYQRYWGLTQSPFSGDMDPARYYANPAQDEALARLQFLIGQQRRLGLLTGEPGTGKSLLLAVLADRLARVNRPCVRLNLTAVGAHEFPWLVATGLGLNPSENDSPVRLWRIIADRVAENRYQRIGTTFLFDDVDQSPVELTASLLRLALCDSSPAAETSLILAADSSRLPRFGSRLLELADLKIELEPWDEATTAGYVTMAMQKAGGAAQVFEPGAAQRIQHLCDGLPRRINHLAELVLAAGAGQKLRQIDGGTVDAVYDELVGAAVVRC